MKTQAHKAPKTLREPLAIADRQGSALVTMIAGRLTIMLPPVPFETPEQQAARIDLTMSALRAAGVTK